MSSKKPDCAECKYALRCISSGHAPRAFNNADGKPALWLASRGVLPLWIGTELGFRHCEVHDDHKAKT